MDGGSQVRRVPPLAVGTATWPRDEEANASGASVDGGSLTDPHLTLSVNSVQQKAQHLGPREPIPSITAVSAVGPGCDYVL